MMRDKFEAITSMPFTRDLIYNLVNRRWRCVARGSALSAHSAASLDVAGLIPCAGYDSKARRSCTVYLVEDKAGCGLEIHQNYFDPN